MFRVCVHHPGIKECRAQVFLLFKIKTLFTNIELEESEINCDFQRGKGLASEEKSFVSWMWEQNTAWATAKRIKCAVLAENKTKPESREPAFFQSCE